MVVPYTQQNISENVFVREFSVHTEESELVWHRDEKKRIIEILSGECWKIQFDNELPVQLNIGDVFVIDKYKYHRIIKGVTDLKILIREELI